MSIIIWVAPFILFLASSYWFNSKKIDVSSINFKLLTLLDTFIGYSLAMLIISQFVVKPVFMNFILIFVFLVSGIIRFVNIEVGSEDLNSDLEIETIKNNFTLFATTFIPFLVFFYLFDNTTPWIQYPLSIILATSIFFISLPIKKYVVKIYDRIDLGKQLVTDLTLSIAYFSVISITIFVLMIIFVFTNVSSETYVIDLDSNYIPEYADNDNIFDWDIIDVLDIASPNYQNISEGLTDFTLLLKDELNKEYVAMLYYPSETQDFSPYIISHELIGSTESSLNQFDGVSKFIVNGYNFVTPSTGLYTYSSTEVELVPGTEGYPVQIIQYETCDTCFLVDHLDNSYTVIDDTLTVIDNIVVNEKLVVINSYLFIETDDTFTRYDDTTISFNKYTGTQDYNGEENIMFTSNRDSSGVTIIRESDSEIIEKHFNINDEYEALTLLSGYIYNPIKVFSTIHEEMLDYDFYIYSYEIDQDDWLSLVVYDPDVYLVEQPDYSSNIQITKFSSNRNTDVYSFDTFHVKNSPLLNSDDEVRVIVLLIIISTFFIFIPITNYRTFTTVIAYDNLVNKDKEIKNTNL